MIDWHKAFGRLLPVLAIAVAAVGSSRTELRLPAVFSSHMVLQRGLPNPVWGWADPGDSVSISIAGQVHRVSADSDGSWRTNLLPMSAGGPYDLIVRSDSTSIRYADVLVGEVWLLSGQSNMEWPLSLSSDADLEMALPADRRLRLLTVPRKATQTAQGDFDGQWALMTPDSVADFSAVGYHFGRLLRRALEVPVGLINCSYGGAAIEAWISRALLEKDARFDPLMSYWRQVEAAFDVERERAAFEKQLADWEAARARGEPVARRPFFRDLLNGNQRPGNLYAGMLQPLVGFGIRGVLWYQGESNAGRAEQYRDLFPLLISSWRDAWGQGPVPFYWAQLADFDPGYNPHGPSPEDVEKARVGNSAFSELREAQTLTLDLPNTGQAVIIDLGTAHDIHPRNKEDVARRLARIALARDYGFAIAHRSPTFESMRIEGARVRIRFADAGAGLTTRDFDQLLGFVIAGTDRVFHRAEARIVEPDLVEVWSDSVAEPVTVRYGWAGNPVVNVYTLEGLPLTPFRTDDWPGVSTGVKAPRF